VSTWVNSATRSTASQRSGTATRSAVCFEILDYDSLTHVQVDGVYVDVVALIYKKVTISHSQARAYALDYSTSEANIKDTKYVEISPSYLDPAMATDEFTYIGSREVEYIFCLLVGATKYTLSLGTMTISTVGDYNLSGTDKNLKEDVGTLVSTGPTITVTGNRLYGVSVNCGNQVVTYSYDIETPVGSLSNNVLFQTDSPLNCEDYNDYWIKSSRVVGAMSYYGASDSKEFPTTSFPDKVMAVGYMQT
jgi:hypothetical protein